MDMLSHWNAALAYIESHLDADCDLEHAAHIACVTLDSFARFFSYMTGMTLHTYVRRRRLTRAAEDVRDGMRIVDIAVKYGYDSAAAFSRAFAAQHGCTPSAYRQHGGSLRVYPPASFHITIKGAKEMDFRLIELPELTLIGVSKAYDPQLYPNREALRHVLWADEDVPGQITGGSWDEPDSTTMDGVWYGVWRDGRYAIAREESIHLLEPITLPAGTYAAFKTPRGGLAWEEFPKLFSLIFDAWLPTSGYRQRGDLAVEVLHLWTDHALRRKNRYYEVWIPMDKVSD